MRTACGAMRAQKKRKRKIWRISDCYARSLAIKGKFKFKFKFKGIQGQSKKGTQELTRWQTTGRTAQQVADDRRRAKR